MLDRMLEKAARRQSLIFLVATAAASVLAVVVSLLLENKFLQQLLLAIGGGFLGACIGAFIGNLVDSSTVLQIKSLLDRTLNTALSAKEEELSAFRCIWYHYHVTKVDGEFVWRHRIYNFSDHQTSDKLFTTIAVDRPDASGGPVVYEIEGFVLSPRLIFVQTCRGSAEPCIVQVYPDGAMNFISIHAGFSVLQTYDMDHAVVPTLFSRRPLLPDAFKQGEGTVSREGGRILDRLWTEATAKSVVVLPRVSELTGVGQITVKEGSEAERELWKHEMFEAYADDFVEVADSRAAPATIVGFIKELSGTVKPKVLDLGSGTGDFCIAMSGECDSVVGVDNAEAMVGIAEKRCGGIKNVSIVSGDMFDIAKRFVPQSFDVVTRLYTSLGYGSRAAEEKFFKDAASLLLPGGVLIVDTFGKRWMQAQSDITRTRRLISRQLSESYVVDAVGEAVDAVWTYTGGSRPPRKIHFRLELYSIEDLNRMAAASGLEVVGVYSKFSKDAKVIDESSAERLILVARRPV